MVKINFNDNSNPDDAAVTNAELNESQWAELEDLLENHNKIGAIKKVREWQNSSLKQAKDFVEAHHKKLCELDPGRFGKAPASGCTVKVGMLLFAVSLGGLWVVVG